MRRLVLFDIDGTILGTNGAAKRAFHRAMLTVYGTAGPIADHPFDGKTDPQIARELLQLAGMADDAIAARLAHLWEAYLDELAAELRLPDHKTHVYPGVRELLDALRQREDVLLGLLTGNIARGAALKLESVGLHDYFRMGAYGSDAERRDALPAIAVQRARVLSGVDFAGKDVVIIGDTPNDVSCGRGIGVRAVAVATGRHSVEALAGCEPDHVFRDLSHTAAVLDAIVN